MRAISAVICIMTKMGLYYFQLGKVIFVIL